MVMWTPFDYENETANPLPPIGEPVWVNEKFYEGVTIGYWADGWWETPEHKDDVWVSHWMPLTKPEPPGEA